jgi:hypothetical protein
MKTILCQVIFEVLQIKLKLKPHCALLSITTAVLNQVLFMHTNSDHKLSEMKFLCWTSIDDIE